MGDLRQTDRPGLAAIDWIFGAVMLVALPAFGLFPGSAAVGGLAVRLSGRWP